MIPMIAIMMIALISAAVYISSITATATISEALSTTTTTVSYSGLVGDTVCVGVDIFNAANVALNVKLTYVETSNPNSVIYTTNMGGVGLTQILASGANTVTTCATYDGASPLGVIAGTITITRV